MNKRKKEKKKILAIVPARGGSKGIKLKNLKKVGEKSLIQLVAEVISESNLFTNAVVSTDHKQIKKEALLDCGVNFSLFTLVQILKKHCKLGMKTQRINMISTITTKR